MTRLIYVRIPVGRAALEAEANPDGLTAAEQRAIIDEWRAGHYQSGGAADAGDDQDAQRQAQLAQLVQENAPPQRQQSGMPTLSLLASMREVMPLYPQAFYSPAAHQLASEISASLPHQDGGAVNSDNEADEYAKGGRVDDDGSADVRLAYVPIPLTGQPQGEPTPLTYERVINPRDKKLYELMHQTGAHHYLSPKHAAVVFRDLLR